jgi:hypothetical protein
MSAGIPPYVGVFWLDLSGLAGVFGSNSEEAAIGRALRMRLDLGTVVVRWESALPVRAAEQKVGEMGMPASVADYYTIAVYDVRPPFLWNLASELKGDAFLKRNHKKDLKPSRVEILRHDDSNLVTVVYLFPRSAEITKKDGSVQFAAQIGRLFVSQFFVLQDMQFEGKPEY